MSSAGFRFAQISPHVVRPPVDFDKLDLSTPRDAGNVSGEIEVTWTATTPICVGETRPENGEVVTPMLIGNRYCLPGPSLKGMIRSVLEVATFSHLGRINAWRHHGIRTYEPDPMPANMRYRPQDLRAGWLTLTIGTDRRKHWHLRPAWFGGGDRIGFRLIDIDALLPRIAYTAGRATWNELSAPEKYAATIGFNHFDEHELVPEDVRNPNTGFVTRTARFPTPAEARSLALIEGHVVLTGGGENRSYETFVAPPDRRPNAVVEVPTAVMEKFHRLHSLPHRKVENCEPLDKPLRPWRYWLSRMGYLEQLDLPRKGGDPARAPTTPGIPVFFIGTPGRPDFFFGLSRVIRLPWAQSVGQAAQNIYEVAPRRSATYRVPRLPRRDGAADADAENGWDFARAMFGWVEDKKSDGWQPPEADKSARALAGRVAVEFAYADGDPQPDSHTVSGILGTPRESFYPFYLRRKEPDPAAPTATGATFDDPFAVPAGRKRYVVRETIERASQVRLPQPPAPAPGEQRTEAGNVSSVRFLPKGTAFKGRIRFHNLDPVELGALLWALTFGEPDDAQRTRRHQIGRAKAHGAGVMRSAVRLTGVTTTDAATLRRRCGIADPRGALSIATLLDTFRSYMLEKLSLAPGTRFEDQPQIAALLAAADPAVGAAAEQQGALATLPLEPPAGANEAQRQATYPARKRAFDAARLQSPRTDSNLLPPLPRRV